MLYRPGDIGREAYIISQGIDGAKCEIVLSEAVQMANSGDHVDITDLTCCDGDLVGVNALRFGSKDVVRRNTATVKAGGDLLLIPRCKYTSTPPHFGNIVRHQSSSACIYKVLRDCLWLQGLPRRWICSTLWLG